jgi:hypothetical protein
LPKAPDESPEPWRCGFGGNLDDALECGIDRRRVAGLVDPHPGHRGQELIQSIGEVALSWRVE